MSNEKSTASGRAQYDSTSTENEDPTTALARLLSSSAKLGRQPETRLQIE